ncbi:hypothetical protein TKK_0011031 [Trichogramma kaykai]|uniref:Multidrug resistance-associated protein lethal(2)03659 n=2 Tax=Trichogramma kaykai TaxID=54128 RepID=A0ABD2WUU6_9HYME
MADGKGHPYEEAHPISRLFFLWLISIFKRGQELEHTDLSGALEQHDSELIAKELGVHWTKECSNAHVKNRKPSLLRAVYWMFHREFLWWGVPSFFYHFCIKIVMTFTLGQVIGAFDNKQSPNWYVIAVVETFCFICLTLFDMVIFNQMSVGLRHLGLKIRVGCSALMFRKIMKLPSSARKASGGRIINLMSNDAMKLETSVLFLHTLWIMPLQVTAITILMWQSVGAYALVGVALLLLQTLPLQAASGRVIAKLRKKIAGKTDERVLLTAEVVRAIRVIKMCAWEKPFARLLYQARRNEMYVLGLAYKLKCLLWAIVSFAQRSPVFVTLMLHARSGGLLSATTVYTLVQYFNVLHVMSGSYFLRTIDTGSEALASLKRIQDFLLLDEQKSRILYAFEPRKDETMINVAAVSCGQAATSPTGNCLDDISFSVKRNMLYVVVGPVGSGKSSLLRLLLDERDFSRGQIRIDGSLSYAPQEPWIIQDTVRNNILLGSKYEEERYRRVVRLCELDADLEAWLEGDDKLALENGANLSGGQCARIGLARAIYREADVYLLDDPLSACDAKVARRLFHHCINGLLSAKTRILVTHQLEYCVEADEIISVDGGRIVYQGDFETLRREDSFFQRIDSTDRESHEAEYEADSQDDRSVSNEESTASIEDDVDATDAEERPSDDVASTEDDKKEPLEINQLLAENKAEEEEKKKEHVNKFKGIVGKEQTGTVKFGRCRIYRKYFTGDGQTLICVLTLLTFVLAQTLTSMYDVCLSLWTKSYSDSQAKPKQVSEGYHESAFVNPGSPSRDPENDFQNFIYLMIGIVCLTMLKSLYYAMTFKKINSILHNSMVRGILQAKMSFFEANNTGNIMNRFTKDLGTGDEKLPMMLLENLEFIFIICGIASVIVYVNPYFLVLILAMGYLLYKLRMSAVKTTRALMRIEAQRKSPVLQFVDSTFSGIESIRAFKIQPNFNYTFDALQNEHSAAAFSYIYAVGAYGMWLDLITLGFITVVGFAFCLFSPDTQNGADVGMTFTQAHILCGILARTVRVTGDVENMLVAVERTSEYAYQLESESQDINPRLRPKSTWPELGRIEFKKVNFKYSNNGQPILRDINLRIRAGSKIGIVGATGAGKSSLVTILFNLMDYDGQIFIDEWNCKALRLENLRKKMSILPQEPQLFSVTLRKNLDPNDDYDDKQIWSVLEDVELKGIFSTLDQQLDQTGLSTGQRQLLCLARALLRKNKILILDEATANVDPHTEALIHATIREQFSKCTIIMIAHRIKTVLDCDRIVVVDQGKIAEYGEPNCLLKNKNSRFAVLAKAEPNDA